MKNVILLIGILLIIFSCAKKNNDILPDTQNGIQSNNSMNKNYKIFIILDATDDWALKAKDGFKDTITQNIKTNIEFKEFNTQLNKDKCPAIINTIKNENPDLICTLNYPDGFADTNITNKLTDPKYKFVSMNPIPVQTKTIISWEKPGGNVTGVGVFIQFNSQIRLMKKINPKVRKMAFYSWDAMTQINEWFEAELKRACKEENIELVEFRRVPYQEETRKFMIDYSKKGNDYFIMCGISAFVHKDGSPIDVYKEDGEWAVKNTRLQILDYDETTIKDGCLAGACVIWYDIGTQLAEKGIKILNGQNPGLISWDYPRKYNIILNLKRANDLNLKIPKELISASYRIYTDYKGNFIGQGK